MKKIYHIAIAIFIMGMLSVISLLVLSLLTYYLKWTADKAEIGIIVTYILAGFFGGKSLKGCLKHRNKNKEEVLIQQEPISIGQKITDAFLIGTLFVVLLVFLSMLSCGSEFSVSARLFVVWLLVVGSACLGRLI